MDGTHGMRLRPGKEIEFAYHWVSFCFWSLGSGMRSRRSLPCIGSSRDSATNFAADTATTGNSIWYSLVRLRILDEGLAIYPDG